MSAIDKILIGYYNFNFYFSVNSPFAVRDVYSRASQLGYIAGKKNHQLYWEKKNPNEGRRTVGKRKK